MYDNDNNIKPIEVNFNKNEYIIFASLSLSPTASFMMTIIVHFSSRNKIFCSVAEGEISSLTPIRHWEEDSRNDSTQSLTAQFNTLRNDIFLIGI